VLVSIRNIEDRPSLIGLSTYICSRKNIDGVAAGILKYYTAGENENDNEFETVMKIMIVL
jgi:hypothetical protein